MRQAGYIWIVLLTSVVGQGRCSRYTYIKLRRRDIAMAFGGGLMGWVIKG